MQNFHYGITDWLPFYWEGYRQTTRYTYMLKDIRNTKAILGNMSFNIRRNITKARDKYHITVKKGISIEEFLLIQAQTFKRQQITNKEDMEVLIKLINICRKRDQGDLWAVMTKKDVCMLSLLSSGKKVPPGIWLVEEIRLFGSPEHTV